MAGSSYLVKNPNFNVDVTTLRDFIKIYAKENAKLKNPDKYINDFLKVKPLQQFLDRPMSVLFETSKNPNNNPYAIFYDNEVERVGTGEKFSNVILPVKSKFQVLQDNYSQNLASKGEVAAVDIVAARITPDKIKSKSKKQIVKPRLMGQFQIELMKYVAKTRNSNPENASKARGALLLMNTGMRPNEILGLRAGDIQFIEESAAPGIVQRNVKTGDVANVVLGPRSYAIVQQQLADLKSQGINITANTPLFKGIDDKVLTNFLKNIKVPGIIEDVRLLEGRTSPAKYDTITSYDFRRLHATAAYNLRISSDEARTAKGSIAGKTQEIDYISPEPGFFEPEATKIPNRLDNYYFNLLQKQAATGGKLPPNVVLDPNADLIKIAIGTEKFKVMPADKPYEIKTLVEAPEVTYAQTVTEETKDDDSKKRISKFDDLPPHIKTILKGTLKTAQFVLPPVGAALMYQESRAEGFDPVESAVIASTEFAPISVGDVKAVKDVAGFAQREVVDPLTKPVAEAASKLKTGFLEKFTPKMPSLN